MSSYTYTDLQTDIGDWLHRSELSAKIPRFIQLCESRINRNIQVRMMEAEASLTMTPGSRYVALPSDFNTPIALWLESFQPRIKLSPSLPEQMTPSPAAGYPEWWAIDQGNLAFDKAALAAYPLTFRYYKRWELSDSSPTNDLLTEYPDIYLYGSLLEAAPYLRDDQRIPVWQDRFDRSLSEISSNESENRAVALLRTEIQPVRGQRFNIVRGY